VVKLPEVLGEYLDRLVTTSMTENPAGGLTKSPRGSLLKLYEFARKKQGAPLTYLAARSLVDRVKRGDFVFIMTGAGAPPYMPKGETDGPLGVAALARTIDLAFGAKPVVITEEEKMDALVETCNAAELAVQSEEWVRKRAYGGAVAESFPINDREARGTAETLVAKYSPVAMIAVEKLAIGAKGVIHNMSGTDRTQHIAKVHHLIDEARRRGILTIGIGDGGNEVGFGMIREELRALGGIYSDCSPCPCKDGVVTVVSTDVLLPAAVSNWGAYGVEACVAAMTGNLGVMHSEGVEGRMLEAGVRSGLASGFGRQMLDVDGTSLEANQALITIMREMVWNFVKRVEPRAF
jgi:hypothetical protein